MKFLEAQQFKKEQEDQEQRDREKKATSVPENKMMPAPANKQPRGKRHTPSTPPDPRQTSIFTLIHPDAMALAKSLGIDLTTVTGTGPDGQILPRDVRETANMAVLKVNFPPGMGTGEPPAAPVTPASDPPSPPTSS